MSGISGVRLAGVAAAVPERSIAWQEHAAAFGAEEAARIAQTTGVESRRVAGAGLTASDLCHDAAAALLDALAWPAESIDTLLFVSQTPDQTLPATAAVLHARLGLGKQAAAFDVNLGCSGFVYGLWLASSLLASGQGRRALVLVGDTISRTVDPADRATAMLFGDAGTATAIELVAGAGAPDGMVFRLGTDGAGREHLFIPGGGFRAPEAARRLRMDGAEVFSFTQREVPRLIEGVLAEAGWALADADAVVFHQANRFLLQHLAKKLKVAPEQLVVALEQHGNTSGASIPLALVVRLAARLREQRLKLVVAGFGVGWSWGAAALEVGPMVVPELVEVKEPAP